MKEYSTKNYIKREAVIGGRRKNIITISTKSDKKKNIKKQNNRGCGGCSRNRK